MAANSVQFMALRNAVQRLQGTWISDEGFSFTNGQWLTSMQTDVIPRCQHLFRQHWRRMRFTAWLQSKRIDSQLAREQGIHATEVLIDRLRHAARGCTGDQLSVLCGGITTDAHVGGLRDFCPDCGAQVCPSTFHVLWECKKFQEFRVLAQPEDPMCARMGWNQAERDSLQPRPDGQHSCTRQQRKAKKSARSGWGSPTGGHHLLR